MWFSAISDKKDNESDGKDTKKQNQPPVSLLSSTAAGASLTSSALPPLHFLSRRSPIYCTNACVATSQPLATSIGLYILRGCGGNAADASVAIAAALAVLEPCSTGLGGDMFALWYNASTKKVGAINGSGRSPCNLNIDAVKQFYTSSSSSMLEIESKYKMGIHSVTVPGAAMGWDNAHKKYGSGKLSLAQILEPARKLAEEGFPVSTLTAMRWCQQLDCITKWYTQEEIENGNVEMSVDGKGTGPKPGQLFRNPYMAKVLKSLGDHGAKEGFYNGKSVCLLFYSQ